MVAPHGKHTKEVHAESKGADKQQLACGHFWGIQARTRNGKKTYSLGMGQEHTCVELLQR